LVTLLFGNKGFRSLDSQFFEKRRLEKNLTRLQEANVQLTQELNLIQTDPTYTEYLIRKNLKYVKKGEVEYRFVNKE
jgi:cell division protein FtsB